LVSQQRLRVFALRGADDEIVLFRGRFAGLGRHGVDVETATRLTTGMIGILEAATCGSVRPENVFSSYVAGVR
jgi:hypothetical protein